MIASLAVSLALAFWSPYHGGPICPTGVHISYYHDNSNTAAWTNIGADDCVIQVNSWVRKMPVAYQCAVVAHELGHNVFNLEHSTNPHNIMYPDIQIPGACYPVKRTAHK